MQWIIDKTYPNVPIFARRIFFERLGEKIMNFVKMKLTEFGQKSITGFENAIKYQAFDNRLEITTQYIETDGENVKYIENKKGTALAISNPYTESEKEILLPEEGGVDPEPLFMDPKTMFYYEFKFLPTEEELIEIINEVVEELEEEKKNA